MTSQILLGIDVGTTDTKVLASTMSGREILVQSTPTRWRAHPGGQVDIDAWQLVDTVIALAAATCRAASDRWGPLRVAALAVTGMAESGVVLTGSGDASSPVISWFDPRGADLISSIPGDLAREFAGVTGIPIGSQVTMAKLLWLRDSGVALPTAHWLHVPELVVRRLGGAPTSEMSLLARTGLLDQQTGALWPAALELLGIGESFIPPRKPAGAPVGRATGEHCPPELRGAVLTVAGHDHPVGAVGCDAASPDTVFDSFGTAEAFVRTVQRPLTAADRTGLAAAGVNAVRNMLPGRWHLLGGTRAGLLLRRALALVGMSDTVRDQLDAAALRDSERDVTGIVTVSGAENSDGALRIEAASDDIDPVALWLATVRHGIAVGDRVLAAMEAAIGPCSRAVVAGGWTRMSSVRSEKQRQLPGVRFAEQAQAGAFGATAFAAFAARAAADQAVTDTGPTAADLQQFVRSSTPAGERIA